MLSGWLVPKSPERPRANRAASPCRESVRIHAGDHRAQRRPLDIQHDAGHPRPVTALLHWAAGANTRPSPKAGRFGR